MFKVGDEVICINDIQSDNKLEMNKVYVVRSTDYVTGIDSLYLEDVPLLWYHTRFKLYDREKKLKKILCIK